MALRSARLIIALASLLLPSTTRAEEAIPSRAQIRHLILSDNIVAARAALGEQLARDTSRAERAALLELFAVSTAWAEGGPPRPVKDATRSTRAPRTSDQSLASARADLIRGDYCAAETQLNVLVSDAQDSVDAARAVELRALARGAIDRADVPPCEAELPAPVEIVTAAPVKVRGESYGWQTLIADGVSITSTPFVPLLGLGLYLTAAPIVHLAHGNIARAGASLGLRVGLPLTGALAGALVWQGTSSCNGHDVCSFGGIEYALVGAAVGGAGAVLIDAAVLSRMPDTDPAPPAQKTAFLRPSVTPRREGGAPAWTVGVIGTW